MNNSKQGNLMSELLKAVLSKYRDHPDFLGIELKDARQRGAIDDSVLHVAARRGVVDDIDVLVKHGADVNMQGDLGNTPLHYAAMAGQISALRKLLELGADAGAKNEFAETPLQVAHNGSMAEAVAVLSCY